MPRQIYYIVLIFSCLLSPCLQAQSLLPLHKGVKSTPLAMTNVEGSLLAVYFKESRPLTKVFQVAKWDGAIWSYLPDIIVDTSATISSMAYYNGAVYVAGVIKKVGGNVPQIAGNIIKFNLTGKAWEPAGTGIPDSQTYVSDLEVYDGNLYAGGSFKMTQGLDSVLNIVVYNGTSWLYVRGGIGKAHGPNGPINAFAVHGDSLAIGGMFSSFSGVQAKNFAIYQDSTIFGAVTNKTKSIKRLGYYGFGGGFYAFATDSQSQAGIFRCVTAGLTLSITGLQTLTDVSSFALYEGDLWAAGVAKIGGKTVTLIKFENGKWVASALPDILQPTILQVLRNQLFLGGTFEVYNKILLGHIARYDRSLVKVIGRVYFDKDNNCNYNVGSDVFLPGRLIQITPGDIIVKTDADGQFTAILPTGTYTIKHLTQKYWAACGAGQVTINYSQLRDTFLMFGAKPVNTNISDVRVNIVGNTGWQVRKGYTEAYTITYENVGTADIGVGNVSLGYNKDINFAASSTAPNNSKPGELNWLYTGLKAGEKRTIDIDFAVPPTVSKDSMLFTASSYIVGSDNYNDDNYDTLKQTLSVGGIGRNAKFVYPAPMGSDSVAWLQTNTQEVDYLIKFENTGTDTVRTLYVIDTIDVNLSIQYTQETGASHPYTTQVINCDPALGKGVLIWTFSNINLPPNPSGGNDYTSNRGHIGFKVQFKSALADGYAFKNKASIVFDYDEPMITNYTYCEVKALSGIDNIRTANTLKVYPNPAHSVITIDNTDGSISQVGLFDMTGREVMQVTVGTEALIQLQVRELPKGIYAVKATGTKGFSYNKVVLE